MWRAAARRASPVAVCAVFLIPAAAHADSILLTGGAVEVSSNGTADVEFLGAEFAFRGGAHVSGGFFAPANCVVPECGPGTTVSLAATWGGNDLPGTAMFRNVTYTHVGSLTDDAAQVLFEVGGSFVVPPGGGLVTAPFVLQGLFAYPVGPFNQLVPVPLTGRGLASIHLAELGDAPGFFFASRVRYELDPSMPTPEPGTLGLLACGLAWAGSTGRRYLRR